MTLSLTSSVNKLALPLQNKTLQYKYTCHLLYFFDPGCLCSSMQQAVLSLHAGLLKDGAAVLQPALFKGYTAETWIAFLSIDETNASDGV